VWSIGDLLSIVKADRVAMLGGGDQVMEGARVVSVSGDEGQVTKGERVVSELGDAMNHTRGMKGVELSVEKFQGCGNGGYVGFFLVGIDWFWLARRGRIQ